MNEIIWKTCKECNRKYLILYPDNICCKCQDKKDIKIMEKLISKSKTEKLIDKVFKLNK